MMSSTPNTSEHSFPINPDFKFDFECYLADWSRSLSQDYDTSSSTRSIEWRKEKGISTPKEEPKADGGSHAWLFLAGCFTIEALIWGFPFSFGVFQNYYSTHAPFSSEGGIAVIGTCAMGVMYLESPFIAAMCQRWPKMRRWYCIVGLLIVFVALVASSFSKHVWHLILTQGVLYAIGGGLIYTPTIIFLDEWFVKRKSLAFGVTMAAIGFSGVILPFVLAWGLDHFSHQVVLLSWSLVVLILSGPILYVVKPRLPSPSISPPLNFAVLGTRAFWIIQTGNTFQGLGFFVPSIYLPTYAREVLGASGVAGTLLVVLLNSTSVLGALGTGALGDHFHITTIMCISTIGTVASVFLLWGVASSTMGWLYVFSLVYGLVTGGWSTTWARTIKIIQNEEKAKGRQVETGLVFGYFMMGRGVGNVLCGPISELLLTTKLGNGHLVGAYGSVFGVLVVFTGVTTLVGILGWLGKQAGWIRGEGVEDNMSDAKTLVNDDQSEIANKV